MWVNGQPATDLSLLDRGLAYGDGLFETLLVHDGKPVLWTEHLARLQQDAPRLGLSPDFAALQQELAALLSELQGRNVIVKIMLIRLAGGRGYRPATSACQRLLSVHPLPDYNTQQPQAGIRLFVCRLRLARQPALAGIKHLNRLEQVLASSEWPDDSCMEGLLLDTRDCVIEGTRTNVFAVSGGKLVTPDLSHSGVAGVLRSHLLRRFGARAEVTQLTLAELATADEIFVCNSVNGVWPVTELMNGESIRHFPAGPQARLAQEWFREAVSCA